MQQSRRKVNEQAARSRQQQQADWIIAYLRHQPKSQNIVLFSHVKFQLSQDICLENTANYVRPKAEYENQIDVAKLMIRFMFPTNIENDE